MTTDRRTDELRVVIVAEHASARFGGEAALPLHYFRVMRRRGLPVWLVTHARTRDELARIYPADDHILFVEDTTFHRVMWQIGKRLPDQISYFTVGFLSRLSTQVAQRRLVRRLVREERINVVHQPMPVSPREPSMMFGFGIPVIIGPMNGGMDYPPAFRRRRGLSERFLLAAGRASAAVLNALMPGKRHAAVLLVANRRTREALPAGVSRNIIEMVENGVDLTLWKPRTTAPIQSSAVGSVAQALAARDEPDKAGSVTFVFMGRLVDWKAVDLLLRAFSKASQRAAIQLWILGEGAERERLEALASELGIADRDVDAPGNVRFAGWLSQSACAECLEHADCLVLPSLLECGGAVVLEAMSMGRPVIATAWGGPLDYLDSTCGVLVQPDSAEAIVDGLAAAMVDVAQSDAARQRMGESGRARVRSQFDWELKVDRMLAVYREVRTT